MFSRTVLSFVCLFLGLFLRYTHVALVYFADFVDCINYEVVFFSFKLIGCCNCASSPPFPIPLNGTNDSSPY